MSEILSTARLADVLYYYGTMRREGQTLAADTARKLIYSHDAALRATLDREIEARAALGEALRDIKALKFENNNLALTVKALTPAANYCLEYKPLLLKAERERDEAVRVLRGIATFGWYAKGAKVARAYLAAREGR